MTDVVAPKRKVDEVEDLSAIDDENNLNKRARKSTEEVTESVEGTPNKDSEDDLEDNFTTLEKNPVQMKRTRGVRVNYAELQVDAEDNHSEDEEEDEEDEEGDDEDQDEDEGATGEEQQAQDAENAGTAYKYVGENGTKGEQASEEEEDNDEDNYGEEEEDED